MSPLWIRKNLHIAAYSCIQYQYYELKADTLKCFHFTGTKTTEVEENGIEGKYGSHWPGSSATVYSTGRKVSPEISMTSCKQINMSRRSRFVDFHINNCQD